MGLVPAAGCGTRLGRPVVPKELFPVTLAVHQDGTMSPVLAIDESIRQLRLAGVQSAFVIVRTTKLQLIDHLRSGQDSGLNLAYLIQEEARGLAAAINIVTPWLQRRNVCLVLPDTVVQPHDAVKAVMAELYRSHADLVLGVFPTNTPQLLGPVRIDIFTGAVQEIADKPAQTDLCNTWGVAAWTPVFQDFLHQMVSKWPTDDELVLGQAFDVFRSAGYKVQAVTFLDQDARFCDIGTGVGLADAWRTACAELSSRSAAPIHQTNNHAIYHRARESFGADSE